MPSPAPSSRLVVAVGLVGAVLSIAWRKNVAEKPGPSSATAYNAALNDAYAWAAKSPGRVVHAIASTSSMLPHFASNAIVGLEPVTPDQLTVGDVATYVSPVTKTSVIHRVAVIQDGHAIFDGINNRRSDGWIPLTAIRHRLGAIFYADRSTTPATL